MVRARSACARTCGEVSTTSGNLLTITALDRTVGRGAEEDGAADYRDPEDGLEQESDNIADHHERHPGDDQSPYDLPEHGIPSAFQQTDPARYEQGCHACGRNARTPNNVQG